MEANKKPVRRTRAPRNPESTRPTRSGARPTRTGGSRARTTSSSPSRTTRTSSNRTRTQRTTSRTSSPTRKTPSRGGGSRSRQQKTTKGSKRGNSRSSQGSRKSSQKPRIAVPPIEKGVIRVIPLGGVEEVGKNMTAVEYGDDIIVIDAGFQFTDEETPGVDYILPNTSYLEDRKDKIRGLFITHGHLDHIGGIPYLIEKLGFPTIYSRQFGAVMIKKRQEEFKDIPPLEIITLDGDETIPISKDLKIKTFSISHAIPDSMGVIVETPHGEVVIMKDARVDHLDGVPTDKEVEQFKHLAKITKNILLFTLDSTGVWKRGFGTAEQTAVNNLKKVIKDVPGRLIIGTFASQVDRIVEIIKAAEEYGKKVVIEGRSMKANVEIIKHLDLLDVDNIISVEQMDEYPPNKIIMLATGAQGEEFAALMRIATKTHKYVTLTKTDTVLLSSSVIPGNQSSVDKLKDNLYRQDAKVITYYDMDIHAGGHGNRDELAWIHKQVDYKFFMPVHGRHFMVKIHSELAQEMGTPEENIVVPDNGSIVEIYDNGKKIRKRKEKAASEVVTVDGFSIGDLQDVVIRDRQLLSEDGIFIVVIAINPRNGKLRKSPDIISRGFVYLRESQDLLQEARKIINKVIAKNTKNARPINFDGLKADITDNTRKFLLQQTAKRPLVIPVILGI